jgi:hypothetical protein
MRVALMLHIVAGTVGLLCGYVALYSAKGAAVHRKSGMLFVYAMFTMATAGLAIAVVRSVAPEINVPAALLTSYLIVTALVTVRPTPPAWPAARWIDVGAMVVAAAIGVVMLTFGIEAIVSGGKRNGMPAFPFLMFGVVGTLGAIGDVRVLRSGALKGAARLARHLWRMSFALFVAALSFTVQLMKMIPGEYRTPALALPMLAVPVTMLYWLWRARRMKPGAQGEPRRWPWRPMPRPEPSAR